MAGHQWTKLANETRRVNELLRTFRNREPEVAFDKGKIDIAFENFENRIIGLRINTLIRLQIILGAVVQWRSFD
jgi:hypothetical protein